MHTYKIKIPNNIKITPNLKNFVVNGPLGQEQILFPKDCTLNFQLSDKELQIYDSTIDSNNICRQANQTAISLIQQGIRGVLTGYRKQLELIGVGYRASIVNNKLELKLGFSHLITKDIPDFLTINCPKQNIIVLQGTNQQKINEFASLLQKLRTPEPYKGKGIFYKNQIILRKQGKKS
jgi:large subunit ribosomal protein L6